jgi:hypothetical protein
MRFWLGDPYSKWAMRARLTEACSSEGLNCSCWERRGYVGLSGSMESLSSTIIRDLVRDTHLAGFMSAKK